MKNSTSASLSRNWKNATGYGCAILLALDEFLGWILEFWGPGWVQAGPSSGCVQLALLLGWLHWILGCRSSIQILGYLLATSPWQIDISNQTARKSSFWGREIRCFWRKKTSWGMRHLLFDLRSSAELIAVNLCCTDQGGISGERWQKLLWVGRTRDEQWFCDYVAKNQWLMVILLQLASRPEISEEEEVRSIIKNVEEEVDRCLKNIKVRGLLSGGTVNQRLDQRSTSAAWGRHMLPKPVVLDGKKRVFGELRCRLGGEDDLHSPPAPDDLQTQDQQSAFTAARHEENELWMFEEYCIWDPWSDTGSLLSLVSYVYGLFCKSACSFTAHSRSYGFHFVLADAALGFQKVRGNRWGGRWGGLGALVCSWTASCGKTSYPGSGWQMSSHPNPV